MKHIELDSRAVRVLAHPLRARLLSELRVHGPANPTALADRLRTNTGATSYHLRKLAEVGLVVETDEGTGKQRFWAAAQDSHSWAAANAQDDPDTLAAVSWLRQHNSLYFAERASVWEQVRPRWPVPWQDAATRSDALMELTPEQLAALMEELYAVLLKYREQPPREGSRQVVVDLNAMPTDPLDIP